MNSELKTIEKYIVEMIQNFDYIDFAPPVNYLILKKKLGSVLGNETPFWKKINLAANSKNWQDWVFYEFKSFKQNGDSTKLGISCNSDSRKIKLVIFTELNGYNFEQKQKVQEIQIIDVWLNHEKLYKPFADVLITGIKCANNIK